MADGRVRAEGGGWVDQIGTKKGETYVASRTIKIEPVTIPGIGTAAAYASGDAFGTSFRFAVPPMGIIANAVFIDLDDEGVNKELVLFSRAFTATADNSAFAVSDADLVNCVGVLSVDTWYNFGNNQLGIATPMMAYEAQTGYLWCQIVTRGADNIAAGSIPIVYLMVTV